MFCAAGTIFCRLDKHQINIYINLTVLIPTTANTKNVTALRQDPVGLLKSLERTEGPQYIFYRSTPKAVLLSLSHYRELVEMVDGYLDILAAQEFEKEDKKKTKWLTLRQLRHKMGLD